MNINSISPGMVEVIWVIDALMQKNTWPPSRTEVGAVVGKSVACIGGYIKRLQVRGLVECGKNGLGLRLTEKGRKVLKNIKENVNGC